MLLGGGNACNDIGYGIFRARKAGSELFSEISDFWACPPLAVNQFGRCHLIGESRLYCSNHILTCLIECAVEEGSNWIITEYEFTKNEGVPFVPLGIKNERFFKTTTNPGGIRSPFEAMPSTEKKKYLVVNNYIRDVFKTRISNKNREDYIRTIALTHYFEKCDQLASQNMGVMYPSIASQEKGVNFSFRGDIAQEVLTIKRSFHVRIERIDTIRGKMDITFLAQGLVTGKKMNWKQIKSNPFQRVNDLTKE